MHKTGKAVKDPKETNIFTGNKFENRMEVVFTKLNKKIRFESEVLGNFTVNHIFYVTFGL